MALHDDVDVGVGSHVGLIGVGALRVDGQRAALERGVRIHRIGDRSIGAVLLILLRVAGRARPARQLLLCRHAPVSSSICLRVSQPSNARSCRVTPQYQTTRPSGGSAGDSCSACSRPRTSSTVQRRADPLPTRRTGGAASLDDTAQGPRCRVTSAPKTPGRGHGRARGNRRDAVDRAPDNGGSCSPDRRYRWRYERPIRRSVGEPIIAWRASTPSRPRRPLAGLAGHVVPAPRAPRLRPLPVGGSWQAGSAWWPPVPL